MSVSINYKNNEILSIPSSGDYKLNTKGKYLEDDIRITATSSGSAAIITDTTDAAGGTIREITTTNELHVAPKTITQNGTYNPASDNLDAYSSVIVNVSGGGGGGGGGATPWVRPSSWPDLSKMDVSDGDILYMTSYADEARGFCSFYISCTGSYTVEVGTISGSTFTAESTQTYSSDLSCHLYYGSANGTYKVLRVTGTAIRGLTFTGTSTVTIDNFYGYGCNQGIIDIVGKLPSGTWLTCGNQYNLINVEISGLTLSGSRSSMFTNCTSLTSLDVSEWDTTAVTSMSSMFSGCYSLMSLDVSEWDTTAVTNMSSMFSGCTSLASLDVSEWDTSAVTNMNNMFSSCASFTSLDVSEWDTTAVTNMSSMFSGCTSLASLDVSEWDTSAVTNMSSMFNYCYSLTSLDVSNWDTGAVTSMSSMFSSCYSLTSLDVSEWDTSAVTSMSSMFSYCTSLTSLDVSNWDTSAVTGMSSMFYNCYSLTSLDVSNWDIGAVTSMSSMFSSCNSLTSLDVSEWDTTAVTNMSSMFSSCTSLTSLDVSNWDTSAVTNMSSMFSSCYSLTSLDVSEWDTSAVTNMSSMFNSCYSLTSLDVSEWDFSLITTASNAGSIFRYCRGLHGSITLPASMAMIGTYCFSDMRSIYEWHFLATTPPTLNNTNAFNNLFDFGGKKIYVPAASLTAYQTASNWSTYASYMVGE